MIDRTYWYDEELADDSCDWEWDETAADGDDPTARVTDEELQGEPLGFEKSGPKIDRFRLYLRPCV